MDIDATNTAPSGDGGKHFSPPAIDALWNVISEQRTRIERLEAGMPLLPAATDREGAGRRSVLDANRTRTPRRSGRSLPAAEAFAELAPSTARYAVLPIMEGFNWSECASRLAPGEWYMVVFRSIRREAADDLTLEMHDYGAYIEAQRRAVGLVYYFRGVTNESRECLSFCIWNSRQEATRAAQLPLHRIAMTMVDEKYESYVLERHVLRKGKRGQPLEVTAV